MKNRYSNTSDQNRFGVAAVECAVVLPMMLILVLGTIELGTALRAGTILNSAVREAGRLANMKWQDIVDEEDTPNAKVERDLRNFVKASGLPGDDLVIAIVYAEGGSQGQPFDLSDESNDLEIVEISLHLPYSSISLFPVRYMDGKTIAASLKMRAGLGGGISE